MADARYREYQGGFYTPETMTIFNTKKSIKMKNLLVAFLCACLSFAATACLSYGDDAAKPERSNGIISKKIFETCAFDFSDTGRLSHRPPGSDDRLTGYRDFCGIDLKFDRRYTPVTTVAIIMYDSKQLKDQAASQGFYKVKDDWKFKGNPLWINFTGFKKLSFQEERNGDDFILIGRQIETGRDQAGTPIVFEGVHILRITPSYLVSMDLPFDVDIPSSTRDNVVNDMIKIVESVHVTASHLPVTQ
jgi:hypothetical protein